MKSIPYQHFLVYNNLLLERRLIMDFSNIDISYIDTFGRSYDCATEIFNTEPITATPKLQKRIRRWITKTYMRDEKFPEYMLLYIGKNVSDSDFILFTKTCYDYMSSCALNVNKTLTRFREDFSEDVIETLKYLSERDFVVGPVISDENCIYVDIDCNISYIRTLVFEKATGLPDSTYDLISFSPEQLQVKNDMYCIPGTVINFDDDAEMPFEIYFTNTKVSVNCFNAAEHYLSYSPWKRLQLISQEIIYKCFLPGNYLNDSEKKLLPLLTEICKLYYFSYIPDEFSDTGLSYLKSLINKHGYTKLLPYVNRLEKKLPDSKQKNSYAEKLEKQLNKEAYAPLFNEIYNMIVESQSEYPSNTKISIYEENTTASGNISTMYYIFYVLILSGFCVSAFITIIFSLISVAVTTLLFDFNTISEMLSDIPWWKILICSWILFDIAIGIYTFYTRKK